MDETEKTDQAVPAPTVEEEEMEVSMTTQLENLIVTPDNTNTPITQTHADESEDTVHTASAAAVPVSGSVCKTDNSDEDDSEDSDRYVHRPNMTVHFQPTEAGEVVSTVQDKKELLCPPYLLYSVTALRPPPPPHPLRPPHLPLPSCLGRMTTTRVSASQPPSKPEMRCCSRSVWLPLLTMWAGVAVFLFWWQQRDDNMVSSCFLLHTDGSTLFVMVLFNTVIAF